MIDAPYFLVELYIDDEQVLIYACDGGCALFLLLVCLFFGFLLGVHKKQDLQILN